MPPHNGSASPANVQPIGGVVAAPGHEVLSRPLAVVAGPARRRGAARTSPRSAKEPVGTADGSVGRLRGSRTRLTPEKLAVTSSPGDRRHPDRHRRRGTAHRGPRGAREPGGVAGRGVGHRRHCARDDSGDWGEKNRRRLRPLMWIRLSTPRALAAADHVREGQVGVGAALRWTTRPEARENYSNRYSNALRTAADRTGRRRTQQASDLH